MHRYGAGIVSHSNAESAIALLVKHRHLLRLEKRQVEGQGVEDREKNLQVYMAPLMVRVLAASAPSQLVITDPKMRAEMSPGDSLDDVRKRMRVKEEETRRVNEETRQNRS